MIKQIEPWIDEEELIQLKRIIESGYVTEGSLTKEFEELIIDLTGAKHAIAMSNGTVGLFCALKALGIGEGDEVIVPDLTFIASANAVIMAGATPIFCDIEKDSFCIDAEKAELLINTKTKAIMPVHLYGQSARLDELINICDEKKIFLVEDAAQGVGVSYKGRHVGTFGDIGVLSFYGNKTITCGEGGIVLTNSDYLAEACYRLKNHGRKKKGIFIHDQIGFNFCFTEMQAAIGISQMYKLERVIKRKKEINNLYNSELKDIEDLIAKKFMDYCDDVPWFTLYLTRDVEALSLYLAQNEIQTRRFFYPLHMQPCYQNTDFMLNSCPNSKEIFDMGLSLPSSVTLSDEEVFYVCKIIRLFFN